VTEYLKMIDPMQPFEVLKAKLSQQTKTFFFLPKNGKENRIMEIGEWSTTPPRFFAMKTYFV